MRIATRERRTGLLAGAVLAVVAIALVAFALHALAADTPAAGTRAPDPIVASAPQAPAPAVAPLTGSEDAPAPIRGTSRAAATADTAAPAVVAPDSDDRIPMTADSARIFMPLYRRAARTFGVDWRLIASIHQQETSFSSAPGTYRGLNFAGCCAGPMQFNVKNGPVTTWEHFRQAYRSAKRPARYPHRTRRHPSVYDDFDAIMAAGALLRANGAGRHLDGSAWLASYNYYGHDFTGLQYANNVLARAVGWSRRGLCVACAVDAQLAAQYDAAFAAPYRAELLAAERRARAEARAKARERARAKRAARERDKANKAAKAKKAATAKKSKAAATSRPTSKPAPEADASAAAAGSSG